MSSSKSTEVEITESKHSLPLKTKFVTEEFMEDLNTFRLIREQANSGLYVYRSKKEIDSIYKWAAQEVNRCVDIFDFYRIIVKLTDFEGSCHNFTNLPNNFSSYYADKKIYLPITLKNLNGRLFQNSAGLSIPLAAEILNINGNSSSDMIERLSQYYTSDGFSRPYKEVAPFDKGMLDKFIMEFGCQEKFRISYKWKDQVYNVTLAAVSYDAAKRLQEGRHSLIYDKKLLAQKYSLDEVADGIYRLSIRGFDFASDKNDAAYLKYEKFLDEMLLTLEGKKVKKLIIDLRRNTGGAGALYEKTYSYLSDRPFRDSFFAYTNFNEVPVQDRLVISPFLLENGLKAANDMNPYLKENYPVGVQGKYYWANDKNLLVLPHEKTFKGQLYLFIDEYVASAGSHLASLMKSYTNAIVIGTETDGGYYEHNGHVPVEYQLPNTGIQTGFSIVHVIQDAQPLDDQPRGSGIIPHIRVHQSAEDFVNHTDVYLKKVLELNNQEPYEK